MCRRQINLAKCFLGICAGLQALSISSASFAQDNGGLQTAVAADLHGEFGIKPTKADDKFQPREVEFQFFAPIDHIFDGNASFAAHLENGQYSVELHEAHIMSSRLIPRSRFKAGMFFLGVGKLNQIHRHDWPFITAPRIHEEIFGDEGAADSGGEFTTLLPLPFFLEMTLGVTNGWNFGHAHGEGTRPDSPTRYLRLSSFKEIGTGGLQFGLNYLGRTDYEKTTMTLLGFDLNLKLKSDGYTTFAVLAEYWRKSLAPKAPNTPGAEQPPTAISQGFYVYPEFYLSKKIAIGTRFDYFMPPQDTDEADAPKPKAYTAISPQFSIAPSEFSRFRIAFNYKKKSAEHDHEHENGEELAEETATTEEQEKSEYDKSIELQATFILGAHPAHDF